MIKKIITIVLSFCMVLSFCNVIAFADDGDDTYTADAYIQATWKVTHTTEEGKVEKGNINGRYADIEKLFNVLINGKTIMGDPYIPDPEAPLTLEIMNKDKTTDHVYNGTISKKVKFVSPEVAADNADLTEDENAYVVKVRNVIITAENLSYKYMYHSLNFNQGLEIDGANVTIKTSNPRSQFTNVKYMFGGAGIEIKNGGSLTIQSAKSDIVSSHPEYAFDYAVQIKLAEKAKIDIDAESSVSVESAEIKGNNPDGPIIDNKGELTIKQDETLTSLYKQSAYISNEAATGADGADAPPAVECSGDSSITISGGSTVESNGDTAVKLAEGATLNTSEDPENAVKAGEGGLTMDNYGDLSGNVSFTDGDVTTTFDSKNLTVKDNNGVISGSLVYNEVIGIVKEDKKKNPDAELYALRVDSLPDPPEDIGGDKIKEGQVVEYADIYIARDGEELKIPSDSDKQISVTLRVGDAEPGTDIDVYHYNESGEEWNTVPDTTTKDGVVTFKTKSFSPYACVYTKRITPIDNPTDKIKVVLSEGNNRVYDIQLESLNGKLINGFMSSEFDFDYTPDKENPGNISYEIVGGENMNVIKDSDGHYEINMDGVNNSSVSNHQIKIGQIIFSGYGKGTFEIKSGVVHTEKTADNIVDTFKYDAAAETAGNLEIPESSTEINIPVETKTVTVNVMFPNKLADSPVDMTDMTVTAKGGTMDGETAYTAEKKLSDEDVPLVDFDYTKQAPVAEGAEDLTANANGYQLEFKVPVPAGTGNRVTFTFSGKGYRTYSVDALIESDDEDPSVTVWNNVMDPDNTIAVVSTDPDSATVKTFLAGDIVEDNTINLYDLSAVVAYFGKTNAVAEAYKNYIQYDLNRDGRIDSKDIAMVLVSWNN